MARRLFTVLSALSLLLCVWAVAKWVAEVRRPDYMGLSVAGNRQRLETRGVVFDWRARGYAPMPPELASAPSWRLGFVYGEGRMGSGVVGYRFLIVPYWWFAALAAVMPVLWLRRYRRDRLSLRRESLNLCPGCGYDLTANVSGTCPECGASVAGGAG